MGYPGFLTLVKKIGRAAPDQMIDNIFNEARKFAGSVPWADDVTAVVISWAEMQKKTLKIRAV